MPVSAIKIIEDRLSSEVPTLACGHELEGPEYRVQRRKGANSWLLIFTLSGQGMLRAKDADATARPMEVILWAPEVFQEYGSHPKTGRWELLWAHFAAKPDWWTFLDWPKVGNGLYKISLRDLPEDWDRLVKLLHEIRLLSMSSAFLDRRLGLAHMEILLLELRRLAPRGSKGTGDSRLDAAISYGLSHLNRSVSLTELAEIAGISSSRFAHLFRTKIGRSPRAFFELQRMERARELLALTSLPIKAVARQTGFTSEFHFSNRFRRIEGQSPSQYRKARQQE